MAGLVPAINTRWALRIEMAGTSPAMTVWIAG
jgi:hypothetical protein